MAWWTVRSRRDEQAATGTESLFALESALLDAENRNGHDHPRTLAARNAVATALLAAGRADDAAATLERTVAGCRSRLGADHPDTLVARGNLAAAQLAAGHWDDGIRALAGNLADRERVLGTEHRATLAARDALAAAYRAGGRPAAALPLSAQVSAQRARVLGPDHPETLTSRLGLGLARLDAGDPGAAAAELESAVRDAEIAGDVDLVVVALRAALAECHARQGQRPRAVACAERAMRECARLLGTDHADTVALRNDVAALRGEDPERIPAA